MTTLAQRCEALFDKAAASLGNDLRGLSVLDLCADNIQASLDDLKDAIVLSGIKRKCSQRIFSQIERWNALRGTLAAVRS